MRRNNPIPRILLRSPKGFSMMELLVVIALMTILAAIAIPPVVSWRQNLEYRRAARALAAALREARSYAISDNRQYRVEIDPGNSRFRFARGNATTNSVYQYVTRPGTQSPVASFWTSFPTNVKTLCDNGITQIDFSPNGRATFNVLNPQATIRIRDEVNNDRFLVTVLQTGRIQASQP